MKNANSGLHDYKTELDIRIYSGEVFTFFQSLRTPWTDNVFVAVTELGNSFVNISMACEELLIW